MWSDSSGCLGSTPWGAGGPCDRGAVAYDWRIRLDAQGAINHTKVKSRVRPTATMSILFRRLCGEGFNAATVSARTSTDSRSSVRAGAMDAADASSVITGTVT